ncbi:hypothetical protein QYM36_003602, partial [Artemia franciscana]
GAYPARLKKVLVVAAPLWFLAPFKVLRLFIPEKLRDRVFTLKVSQLVDHLPVMAIPHELGGSHQLDHGTWLRTCFQTVATRNADLGDIGTPCEYTSLPNLLRSSYEHIALENDDNRVHGEAIGPGDVEIILSNEMVKTATSVPPTASFIPVSPPNGGSPIGEGQNSPIPPSPASSSGFSDDDSLGEPTNGMTLHQLLQHLSTVGRKGLYSEYAEIKSRSPEGTFNNSRLRLNLPKNRYTDVLCFDHSRVTLEVLDGEPSTDYINANFVDGYRQKRAFIFTQGPLPKTAPDFWRMVWEQQCLLVVMLTRAVERGRTKCAQYWPIEEEGKESYGDFEVVNMAVENQPDYVITNLHLTNLKTRETKTVTHMQFSSWPDYGVPHSALAFLDFLHKIREIQNSNLGSLGDLWNGHSLGPPIVVHCSAGIGRTGTLCTIDICLQRLQDVGTVDVRGTVEKLRAQRAYSIQMPDQYVFCHLAIIEAALSLGLLNPEVIDLTGFDSEPDDE